MSYRELAGTAMRSSVLILFLFAQVSCGEGAGGNGKYSFGFSGTVDRVSEKSHLERLVLLGNTRLVCQRVWRFSPDFGAYRQLDPNQRWYTVDADGKQATLKSLFDKNTVVPSLVRYTTKREGEFLAIWVEDHTPSDAIEPGTVHRDMNPPKSCWIFHADGRHEERERLPFTMLKSRTGRGYVPPPGVVRQPIPLHESQFHLQTKTGQNPKVVFLFSKRAPWPSTPRGRYRPMPNDPGFHMWENAGRSNAPTLKYYRGRGIEIRQATQKRILTDQTGLPSNRVSFCNAVDPNTLWIGFYDQAPVRVRLSTGRITMPRWGNRAPRGVSLIESSGEYLWIGTFTDGLFLVDSKSLQGARVQDIPDCRVNDLQIDKVDPTKIWVATSVGLYLLKLKTTNR